MFKFNALWASSDKTRIVKQRKKLIEKVLSYIVTVSDLSDVTLSEILEEYGATADQYDNALWCVEKSYQCCINKNHVKYTSGHIILLF